MPSLQIRGPGPPSALSRRPLSFRFNLHSLAENPGPSPAAQPPKRSFPPSPDTPGNRVFHGTGKCQGGSSAGAERVLLARGRQGAASRKPPGCSRPHPAPSAWAAGPAAPLPTSAFFSLREPMPGLRCTEGAGLTCDGGPDRTWGCPVLPVHQLLPWRPGPLEAEASGTVSWGPLGLSVGQAGAEGAWGGCLWAPPRRSPGEQVGVVVVVGELVEEGAGLQDEGGQHHAGQVHARPQLLQQDPHQTLVLVRHCLYLRCFAQLPAEGPRSGCSQSWAGSLEGAGWGVGRPRVPPGRAATPRGPVPAPPEPCIFQQARGAAAGPGRLPSTSAPGQPGPSPRLVHIHRGY